MGKLIVEEIYRPEPTTVNSPLKLLQELRNQLLDHLEKLTGKTIISQVNEVAMFIKFKGDHVLKVKDWLVKAGM